MTDLYACPSTTTAEVAAHQLDHRDEEVMQALATAGALVALADGRVETLERDELVNFVDRQGFVPTISRRQIAEVFDSRVQQIEDRDSANVTIEALRPLAGLSLASVVVRTAEQVAAADGKIHARRIAGPKADTADHDDIAGREGAHGGWTHSNAIAH